MGNATKGYWRQQAQHAAQRAAHCDLALEQLPLGNPCARYLQLSASGTDGQPLSARVVQPVGKGPHPVVLMFHDAGRGVRGWHHMTRFVALGFAVVALQNRSGVEGVLVEEPLAVGGGLGIAVRVPTCATPLPTGRELSADTSRVLEATICDALVLAHLLPRLDGLDLDRVVTWGEGLGGGLALATAALAGAQAACALNPLPAALDGASARCDVARIAEGLACPVLMGTGLLDLQASPQAQDAIVAGLQDVTHITYPRYGHERINAFEDELFAFLVAWQEGFKKHPLYE